MDATELQVGIQELDDGVVTFGDGQPLELGAGEEVVWGCGLTATASCGWDWRGHEMEAEADGVNEVFIGEAVFRAGRGGAQPGGSRALSEAEQVCVMDGTGGHEFGVDGGEEGIGELMLDFVWRMGGIGEV